jgi:hypothetical protein
MLGCLIVKEFERTCKERILASFYVLSEEINKKLLSEWRVRGRDSSKELPNYKSGASLLCSFLKI